MAPLLVLLSVFAGTWLLGRKRLPLPRIGRIALAAMFVVTGIAHFTSTAAMAAMLPPAVPATAATALVWLTGVIELGFAAALVRERPSRWLPWLIVAFLLAVLPANVYSALAGVGLGAKGPAYLWFRVPFQLLLIGWTLGFVKGMRPAVTVLPSVAPWRLPS